MLHGLIAVYTAVTIFVLINVITLYYCICWVRSKLYLVGINIAICLYMIMMADDICCQHALIHLLFLQQVVYLIMGPHTECSLKLRLGIVGGQRVCVFCTVESTTLQNRATFHTFTAKNITLDGCFLNSPSPPPSPSHDKFPHHTTRY